jgi:hypothetical protein
MFKSWSKIKTLVVGTNIACEGYVNGWCIGARVNVSQVK